MPNILISGGQNLIKNSYASSPSLDLTLICNGEEPTSIFDSLGNIFPAGLDTPTVAPSVSLGATGGVGVAGYVCYRYVYAATLRYPFVENITAAGGNVSPRSNPSNSSAPFLVPTLRKKNVTVTKTTRSDINKIWIYRTETFNTALLAAEASEAGQLFYVGEVSNDGNSGTTVFVEDIDVVGGEQLEFDNFQAPTAAYCVYYEPYFYAFGNIPLEVQVEISYNTVGPVTTVTLTDPTVLKWFKGRNKQSIRFVGVTTGGYDGFGTYYFRWLSDTTGQLVTDTELNTNGYIGRLGETTATIFGYATTLYRSKANNPFSWGKTVTIGSLAIPELFTLKVGGGIGTGIAVLPSNAILKLDTENPARCYTLNLKLQDDEDFESTLRILSDTYSTSINSTQFATLNRNQNAALWSLDLKNYAIVECEGVQQVPISDPIFKFLRNIEVDETSQRNYHGVFDPYTECNFIWVREKDASPVITHCVYQHVPTGQWGMALDFDITASASVQDAEANETLILGGTDTGIFGRILKPFKFINWLPDPTTNTPNAYRVNSFGGNFGYRISRDVNIEAAEDQTYFIFRRTATPDPDEVILMYYNIGGAGGVPVHGLVVDLEISINVALDDTPSVVYTAIETALVGAGISSLMVMSNGVAVVVGTPAPLLGSEQLTAYNTNIYDRDFDLSTELYVGQAHPTLEEVVGTWVLVDAISSSFWLRIVDQINSGGVRAYAWDKSYGTQVDLFNSNSGLYLGLIECKLQKSFDLNAITKRKTQKEFWVSATQALTLLTDPALAANQYYSNQFLIGFNSQQDVEPTLLVIPNQDTDKSGDLRDMFFVTAKNIPSNPMRTFGVTLIQRGYQNHTVGNFVLKMTT